MKSMINLAIQVLPMHMGSKEKAYAEVDKAIEIIRQSGLKYKVTPFETVIAGEYSETMKLVDAIRTELLRTPGAEFIINMKLQISADNDIRMEDKTSKYENS